MIDVRPAHDFHVGCDGRVVTSKATRHAPFAVSLAPNGLHVHVVDYVEFRWIQDYGSEAKRSLNPRDPSYFRPWVHVYLACGSWRSFSNSTVLLMLEQIDPDLFVACPRCWPLGDGPLCSCSKKRGHRCNGRQAVSA